MRVKPTYLQARKGYGTLSRQSKEKRLSIGRIGLAFAAILRSVPPEILHQAHCTIGLARNQIPSGRCTASVRIQHQAAVEGAHGESVDDFSMRITGLANSITTLGGSISETEIVKKMLCRSSPITSSKSRFQSRHFLM